MILEAVIVVSLFTGTQPVYIREAGPPFAETDVRLELYVKKLPFKTDLYLEPYIVGTSDQIVRQGGLVAEYGKWFGPVKWSVFHESIHNFDRFGRSIQVNGVRGRWCIGC